LSTLNILCDVIRDVIDKHVYIWRVRFIGSRTVLEMTDLTYVYVWRVRFIGSRTVLEMTDLTYVYVW